jgi:hypothetical protein
MSLDLAGLSLTRAQGRQEVGGRSAVDLQIQTVKAYKSRVRAKWLSFALFISLVLLSFFLSQPLFARAQQAGVTTPSDQNEKIPPGSYQLTCVRFDARGNDLRAVCEARNGDWLETELQNARACARDIANDNGKLTCNRNKIAPPAQFLDLFGFRPALRCRCANAGGELAAPTRFLEIQRRRTGQRQSLGTDKRRVPVGGQLCGIVSL